MARLLPPGTWLVSAALAALVLHALPAVAWAHANFDRSEPPAGAVLQTAPQRLQLWFTEPPEPRFSEVRVLDANRQRVDLGDSRVPPGERATLVVSLRPLAPGSYTVAWKVLSSVDGHVTGGTYSLVVGLEQSSAPTAEAGSAPASLPFEAAAR